MDKLDELFSDIENQYQDESMKYRRLKICKYRFLKLVKLLFYHYQQDCLLFPYLQF